MLKILLVATVQSHIAQFHKPLIDMLKEKGCVIDVAARDNLNEKNGLKIEKVNNIYDIPFSRSPINKNNIMAYKKLRSIILENNYDIIHCNTPMGSIITRLIKKNYKQDMKTKIIYTAHGFHFYHGAPFINWMLYYPIEKYFSKYTDVLITINEEDYNIAKNRFKKTSTKKIYGTGINLKKFQIKLTKKEKEELENELNIEEKDFVIINIGELNKNKNQIMQLRAMKKLINEGNNDIKMFICGNGPLKQIYTNYIKENKLEKNVVLLGYRTDINKILQLGKCVIATSLREGLGINILEAMASGVPVIATKNRGHKELIENNVDGYLIEPNNIKSLVEYIKMLKIGENNNIRYNEELKVKKYSEENVKEQLKKIYNELGV